MLNTGVLKLVQQRYFARVLPKGAQQRHFGLQKTHRLSLNYHLEQGFSELNTQMNHLDLFLNIDSDLVDGVRDPDTLHIYFPGD